MVFDKNLILNDELIGTASIKLDELKNGVEEIKIVPLTGKIEKFAKFKLFVRSKGKRRHKSWINH